MDLSKFDLLVVGAGFFGSVIAERAAADANARVLVIDRRKHVGGNCYSAFDDATGIEYHAYGTHIFHTSNADVWAYVRRFGEFNDYCHSVFTTTRDGVFPMPINLQCINQFYRRSFSPAEARAFLEREISASAGASVPRNLEEKAIAQIGRPLYEALIRGYTAKQWETDPTELPASVISRLPVRFDYDGRYFTDTYQGIPRDGYTRLFERMLRHPNIEVTLETDWFDLRRIVPQAMPVVYTGPIDRYFDNRHGPLGFRTIDLALSVEPCSDFQGTAVMNFADQAVPYTRVHEFKHLHPERAYRQGSTLIAREYSRLAGAQDEPFYPIATAEDQRRFGRYQEDAARERHVVFGGRLGSYRYLDMHQAIGAALLVYERDVRGRLAARDDRG